MREDSDGEMSILSYVKAIWKKQGKNFNKCEICGKYIPNKKYNIHHTKYEKATIYDLQIVCMSCNFKKENRNLK